MRKLNEYEGEFILDYGSHEIKGVQIFFTDVGGEVTVRVNAPYREFTRNADGTFAVNEKQVSNHCVVDKSNTVEELCDNLKKLLNSIPDMIHAAKNGDRSKDIT